MAATTAPTTIHDVPDVLLSNILATISDTRTRNAAALVCRKWRQLERATRTRLTLRGNVRDLLIVPNCFRSVKHLDLSLLSPWGHSLSLSPSPSAAPFADPSLLAHCLLLAFPSVTSLTVYARSPSTLSLLSPHWPFLTEIKLVRWHQRPQAPLGVDFFSLFEHCSQLKSIDLSCFYCWIEDLHPVLKAHPQLAQGISRLNLLNLSFAEGFKAKQIETITAACPNLQELLVACTFDPRYIGFVGADALLSIPSNCKGLRVLQLVDISSSNNGRGGGGGDVDAHGFASEDAGFGRAALIEFFSGLPLIEELVLDVRKNVRDSGMALEMLAAKCPNLKSLKLGHFHGLCLAIESHLDGLALCQNLECLSITNSADLTDFGLIAIARGCSKLAKFEIEGCKKVTMRGIRTMASLLRPTLVNVKISCCDNLDAAASVKAVEPIRDRIQRLHIDCIWDSLQLEQSLHNFDLNKEAGGVGIGMLEQQQFEPDENGFPKRLRFSSDLMSWEHENSSSSNGFWRRSWERLEFLSLWIPVGELLTPLETIGLEHCPNLEEIHIKVEGDCRERPKPAHRAFGLSTLSLYPKLWKMKLDCGDTIGFALTAPSGHMDLSLWERFFLNGIQRLSLQELNYWPPADREMNQRTLSQPAVALLQQCYSLRKLFIHGTAHEHFMNFLLKIENLRDVQLRQDYYPAPENDMCTEMRVDSCCRFEDALNRRRIPD